MAHVLIAARETRGKIMSYQGKLLRVLLVAVPVAMIMVFQNCSKVQMGSSDGSYSSSNGLFSVAGKCSDLGRTESETWWVVDGEARTAMACKVGVGSQFEVFNKENQMTCLAGLVQPTGQTRQTDTGRLEGTCNVSCGSHSNNESFWINIGDSNETTQCKTSTTVSATSHYKNEAEYKCQNTVSSATGQTRKTILDETACPPLGFNNLDNVTTLAYEDNQQDSDSDFNDFVSQLTAQETYNTLGSLTKITLHYAATQKYAGLFQRFALVFDGHVRGPVGFSGKTPSFVSAAMFEGAATIHFQRFDQAGKVIQEIANASKSADLELFDDTSAAVREHQSATVTITNLDGDLNTLSKRKLLSIIRYRTVLRVGNPNSNDFYDNDLSDINPTMFDNHNNPLAFFVPVNWRPPKEGVNIGQPYPLFKDHSAYLHSGQPAADEPAVSREWFNTLKDPASVL